MLLVAAAVVPLLLLPLLLPPLPPRPSLLLLVPVAMLFALLSVAGLIVVGAVAYGLRALPFMG